MVIYRTLSFTRLFIAQLFRLGYLLVIFYCLYHFNENPIVTGLISLVFLLFFLLTGDEEIIVYSDNLKYKSGSIIKGSKRDKTYDLKNIKSIEICGEFTTADELISKPISWKDKQLNEITITLTDGTIRIIKTGIYRSELENLVDVINKLKTR